MCKHNSGSHGHHQDQQHHHHADFHEVTPSLSRKERLAKRLEHYIRHNKDHSASFSDMAKEAAELGGEQAAQSIRDAAELTARQNESLERALLALISLQQ